MIIALLQATSSELAYVRSKEYKHYHKIKDGKGDVHSGNRTRDLALHFFDKQLFWLCFSDVPAPSRSSWVVE